MTAVAGMTSRRFRSGRQEWGHGPAPPNALVMFRATALHEAYAWSVARHSRRFALSWMVLQKGINELKEYVIGVRPSSVSCLAKDSFGSLGGRE
jgi:hypothetical protein